LLQFIGKSFTTWIRIFAAILTWTLQRALVPTGLGEERAGILLIRNIGIPRIRILAPGEALGLCAMQPAAN
jgi:hypothetical protein